MCGGAREHCRRRARCIEEQLDHTSAHRRSPCLCCPQSAGARVRSPRGCWLLDHLLRRWRRCQRPRLAEVRILAASCRHGNNGASVPILKFHHLLDQQLVSLGFSSASEGCWSHSHSVADVSCKKKRKVRVCRSRDLRPRFAHLDR